MLNGTQPLQIQIWGMHEVRDVNGGMAYARTTLQD